MNIILDDNRDFTWLYFTWNECSHPEISMRIRLFRYVLNFGYLRIRPWNYLHGPSYAGLTLDKRFVVDLPKVYKLTDEDYHTQTEWKEMQSQVNPSKKIIAKVNARATIDREWTNHLIRHDLGLTLDQKFLRN